MICYGKGKGHICKKRICRSPRRGVQCLGAVIPSWDLHNMYYISISINYSENSRMIYLLVLQFWLTVAANPVIRDLTIKNQWRQWRGRELRVTINSNLMIVMMPVQDPGPAHQRSGWCHGWAQTLTPVWRVITGRDWFCFYFCLICDLSGGCTGHTMPNCPRPVPAASRHQELNSGLRCEMWCVPCYRILSSGR